MIKLYYNKNTNQFINSITSGEVWVQGDDDSKELEIYFGTVVGGTFVNGLTNNTVYNQNCVVNITRPGESSPAALATTAITSGTNGYYKLLVDSWVCEIAGSIKIDVQLKTATTTEAFGQATLPINAGTSGSEETITATQYNALLSTINEINGLKLNKALKGYYFAVADLELSGTLTTQAYVAAVANALTDSGGSYLFSGTAMIQNDGVVISDQPASVDEVLMILNTDDALSINSVNGILLASKSKASGYNLFYANFNILSGTTTVTSWRRILTDVDFTTIATNLANAITAHNVNITSHPFLIAEINDLKSQKANLVGGNTFLGLQKFAGGIESEGANLKNKKITNVADGTANTDAVNKAQLDAVLTEFKQRKIIGIDLQNDILLDEFKTALGLATTVLSGLMSATDKARLDALHALLEEDEENSVVDSINEILAIFNNYPEGVGLVTALAGKVDKVEGKGLSANDYTDAEKNTVASAKTHYETTDGTNPHLVKFVNIRDKPSTLAGFGITDAFTKTEVQEMLDDLKTIYGLYSETVATVSTITGETMVTPLSKFVGFDKVLITVEYLQQIRTQLVRVVDIDSGSKTTIAFNILELDFEKNSPNYEATVIAGGANEINVTYTGFKMDKSQFNEIRNIEEQSITYRTDGKVSQVVGDNVTTTPTYDTEGNLIKITEVYALDGKTYETTFTRDALGRIINTNKQEVL